MELDLDKLTESLVLTEEENTTLRIPDEEWNKSIIEYDLALVGRLLTSKPYNLQALRHNIIRVMNPRRGMDIRLMGGDRLLFQFNHIRDKERIQQGSPWSFDKHVLILNTISKNQDPMDVDLTRCDFFIQIRGLPVSRMNSEIAKFIGDKIGAFKSVDLADYGGSKFSFLRIMVSISVMKPLLRVLRITNSNGDNFLVKLQYERLPNFCYLCGMLGHTMRDCDAQYKEDFDPNAPLPFGAWLRAQAPNRRTETSVYPHYSPFSHNDGVWNAGHGGESTAKWRESVKTRGVDTFGKFLNPVPHVSEKPPTTVISSRNISALNPLTTAEDIRASTSENYPVQQKAPPIISPPKFSNQTQNLASSLSPKQKSAHTLNVTFPNPTTSPSPLEPITIKPNNLTRQPLQNLTNWSSKSVHSSEPINSLNPMNQNMNTQTNVSSQLIPNENPSLSLFPQTHTACANVPHLTEVPISTSNTQVVHSKIGKKRGRPANSKEGRGKLVIRNGKRSKDESSGSSVSEIRPPKRMNITKEDNEGEKVSLMAATAMQSRQSP